MIERRKPNWVKFKGKIYQLRKTKFGGVKEYLKIREEFKKDKNQINFEKMIDLWLKFNTNITDSGLKELTTEDKVELWKQIGGDNEEINQLWKWAK